MEKTYLYGASGHAKVLIEIAEQLRLEIGGLVDANPEITSILDYPVSDRYKTERKDWIIAIGNNQIRKKIAEEGQDKHYGVLIHPRTAVSERAEIAVGTVVMAGVSINSGARIGSHCIINTNASIDHDCIIDDFVHISPNAALAGGVRVGEGTHVGIGACILQNIRIGNWCTIGAGAVVIKDVPDNAVLVGNPGRIIKYNG